MVKREKNIEFIRVFAIFMTVMIHVSNFYMKIYTTSKSCSTISSIPLIVG